jgi:dienelactone hydrolase
VGRHVVLCHAVLGVRPSVRHFAEALRDAGHEVTVLDLFEGRR